MAARRTVLAVGGALIALPLLVVLTLHSRSVRSRVLAMIEARLRNAGIVLYADTFDYNLSTLSVHVSGVTLATAGAPSEPFFSADDVRATLGRRLLVGDVDIKNIDIARPRVVLRRGADGQTNWSTTPTHTPSSASSVPLRIARAHVGDLVFVWQDALMDTNIQLGVSLDLTFDGRDTSGPVTMMTPARVKWRSHETAVTSLAGWLTWNGRDLSIAGFSFRSPEGAVRADGRIEALLGTPRMDLRVVADSALPALSQWMDFDRPIKGTAHVDARIVGPPGNPDTTLMIAGRDIAYEPLPLTTVDATAHVVGSAVELTSARARVADGLITARGRRSAEGSGRVEATWQAVDLRALLRKALENRSVIPAARTSGSLEAQWTAPQLDVLDLTATANLVGSATGAVRIAVRRRQWSLSTNDLVTLGARATATLRGTLEPSHLAGSSVIGSIRLLAPDNAAVAGALTRAGLLRTAPPIRGTTTGDFVISGTVAEPSLDGRVEASVQYQSLPLAALRTDASVTKDTVRLKNVDVRMRQGSARGELLWSMPAGKIDGRFDGSVPAKDLVAAAFPDTASADGSLALAAALSGSTANPRVEMTSTSGPLEIAGQHIDRLAADLTVNGSQVGLDRLALESGAGRLDAHGTFDLTRQTYSVHAAAHDLPLRPPVASSLNGYIDGEGSLSHLGAQAHVALSNAQWQTADLGSITIDLNVKGRDASFVLNAPDLALKGNGTIGVDANGPVSVRGEWVPDDVEAIGRRWGAQIPFSHGGSASLRVEFNGSRGGLADGVGRITLDRVDLRVADEPVRLTHAGPLQYQGRTVRVDNLGMAVGNSTLTIDGAFGDTVPGPLTLALDGSLNDFAFIRRIGTQDRDGAAELTSPSGSMGLRLALQGSLEQPRVSGTLQVSQGKVALTPAVTFSDIQMLALYGDGLFTVDNATAAFANATFTGSARAPGNVFRDWLPESVRRFVAPSDGPATLSAKILSITPSIAAPFATADALAQLGGRIDASVQLEAAHPVLNQLSGTITLDRAELSTAGVSIAQQVPTRLVVRDGRIDIDTWRWGDNDNGLALSGSMTLGDDPALAIDATSAVDLRFLNAFTPNASIAGRADTHVRAGGTIRSPTLDGYVTLSNGEVRVADPRLVVGDVTGTVTLAGDRVTVERVWATVNGGNTEFTGTMRHRWLTPVDGQLTVRASGAALDVSGLRAEADANVVLTVDREGPVVGGTVTLLRSTFREPLSLTRGLLRTLQVSSTAAQSSPAGPLGPVRLDVRIATQDDLVVDNNYAQLVVAADLRLVGTTSRPSVTGRATLAEGGLIFFGANRYRLADQGSIDFANPGQFEPDLNLRAVTRVQGTDITIALKGTPATLQTTLTSDNPALSESDLVSLLVVGRTAIEAASAGFAPGTEELLGYLSGELLGAAGRAVGLDTLRVERGTPDVRFDAGLVASETDPTARLTLGKNVGSKVEVIFSQSLQQSGGLTWIVSYAPRSGISTRVVSLDSGDRLYDFRHDLTFGNRPSGIAPAATTVPTVSAVQIAGAGADEPPLRSRLKLEPGDRFSFFRWQDDRDRVEAFYHERGRLEARVAARRIVDGADSGHVALAYDVRPGPRTTLRVDGFSFSRSARHAMEIAWTRAIVDAFLVDEVADIARAELADAGFMQASVTATVEHPVDEKRLLITVDPGLRVKQRKVAFDGNRNVSADRLLQVVSDHDLNRAVWIEPDRVRGALEDFYHAIGYLDAAVRMDPISVEGGTAVRRIHVDEGAAFRLRNIRVEGVRAMSADDATRIIALAPGDVFTESTIDRAHLALDARYRSLGFNNVAVVQQVAKARTTPEGAVVDVDIQIDEGPQQRLREIVTTGLARTNPAIARRALDLKVGEPVDLARWSAARRRMYETGAFRSVDIQREVMPSPEATPVSSDVSPQEPIRARVTVEEWPPARLRYGLEVNDRQQSASEAARTFVPISETQGGRTLGIGATGDLTLRNLFGRAVSAGVAGRLTSDFRAGRVYSTAPSFVGLPITSNVFLERSREQLGNIPERAVPAFLADRTTFTIEQRVKPLTHMELAYRYQLETNHTFTQHPDPSDPLPFDVAVTTARLASTISIDTRNDILDPRQGWFHSSDLEYATAWLHSDLRFVRYLLQQRYYHSSGDVVFATWARVGLATGFEQSLIPSERFFAGGGNSVRGYAQDTLSPRDVFGDTVGGDALLVLNQEVRFPLFKNVRGVAFADAGRAFEDAAHLSLRDLSISTGFGLRVQTPVVLLRVDYGVPFAARVVPRRGRWFFSIGQTF